MKGPYRIVLGDGHVLFRQGLKRILNEKNNLEIVGEAGDGLELLILLNKLNAHMVILDISMPNPRGIEATHQIKMIFPNMKVLILSMHREKEYFSQAMAAGADGYLLKEYADAEIFTAIEIIEQGGIYVSPLLSEEA